MLERNSPWDYRLTPTPSKDKPHELRIDVDLPTYIAMAMELSGKIENRITSSPTLLYVTGSGYLASLLVMDLGIGDSWKIFLTDSPESVFVEPDRDLVVVANQNISPTLVPFARTVELLFKPKSLTVGVLFENEDVPESREADIAIYRTRHRVKFPALPEIGIAR